MLTTVEMVEQAKQLHKQGQNYQAIAKHFADLGFKSERTGKPIKWNAIRYWIFKDEAKEKTQAKADSRQARRDMRKADKTDKQQAIQLVAPKHEVVDMLKAINDSPNIPEAMRHKMFRLLLKQA